LVFDKLTHRLMRETHKDAKKERDKEDEAKRDREEERD
jgi:hypothetical protein